MGEPKAVVAVNRRRVRESIDKMQVWLKRLEDQMDVDPDGVIPWIPIQTISEGMSELVYSAGHVNGVVLAEGREQ